MKHRLCFRLPASSCTKRHVFEHEYFSVPVRINEYYVPNTFSEKLEFELFKMIVDVWLKRRASKFYSLSIDVEPHDKASLKLIVTHVRRAWYAHQDGNELLARYEFRTAETHWLRFGFSQTARIAGKALLEIQKRSIDGKHNIKRRWNNKKPNEARDRRIREAVSQGKAVKDLAESYNLTPRSIQLIVKKKTK